MHTIELCDNARVPRLRIDLPEGKDAEGKRLSAGKELCYTLEDDRLTLSADLSQAKFPVIIDPSWSSTGSMAVARSNHTANILGNGQIFVAGGMNGSLAATNTTELFDPTSQTWTSGPNLVTARMQHQSALLKNGKVLLVGGFDGTLTPTTQCEIYDFSTGCVSTGSLSVGRIGHTLSVSGSVVLVAGGSDGNSDLSSCQTYDDSAGSWVSANPMAVGRRDHQAVVLNNNHIMVIGGNSAACEDYDPNSGLWTSAALMHAGRSKHHAVLLQDGRVFVNGGNSNTSSITAELFSVDANTWTTADTSFDMYSGFTMTFMPQNVVLAIGGNTSSVANVVNSIEAFRVSDSNLWGLGGLSYARKDHTASQIAQTIIVTGGITINSDGGLSPTPTVEIFDSAPTASTQVLETTKNVSIPITLTGQPLGTEISFQVTAQPVHGTITGTPPQLVYTPSVGYSGADQFDFSATDGFFTGAPATITITVINTKPNVTAMASTSVTPESAAAFTANGTDADGDSLIYSWDFGDNSPLSNEQNPTHAYADVGTYTATVTVTDPAGATGQASVVVNVSKAPVPRLVTSDVVGFGGLPLQFDASYSTDPENAIAIYDWDFGDGTPHGSGQVISKIYDQPGTYTVTLTVTDSAGVASTIQRVIEVLPADQAGLFNGFFHYKVKWNRDTENKDTLSFDAQVNVGDLVVGKDTPVALDIVGQHFDGVLDLKLRDYSNANDKWQVKANIRKEPFGTVLLKVKIKNASLGLGFNQAGATAGADPHDLVDAEIPVRLTIGDRSFELNVSSEFKSSAGGHRASGEGEE